MNSVDNLSKVLEKDEGRKFRVLVEFELTPSPQSQGIDATQWAVMLKPVIERSMKSDFVKNLSVKVEENDLP